jgi:hypothetical protein
MVKPDRMSYGNRLFVMLPLTFVVNSAEGFSGVLSDISEIEKFAGSGKLVCDVTVYFRFFRIRIAMMSVTSEC